MCHILASVLNRPLKRLKSDEGPALGAAVTALAAFEARSRKAKRIKDPFTVADAVEHMVRFGRSVEPVDEWVGDYQRGLTADSSRQAWTNFSREK